MALLEENVEDKLIKICKKHGIKTVKGLTHHKGFPDRLVFNHKIGEIHYIEIKNNTYYKASRHQKKWRDIILASGGKHFLIDGEDEMDEYINKYIKEV